jgi:hypothetical protein
VFPGFFLDENPEEEYPSPTQVACEKEKQMRNEE